MSRVLVTGASGFVGAALLSRLAQSGILARGSYRARPAAATPWDRHVTGSISGLTDWSAALHDVSVVVHLAGPAHAGFSKPTLDEQMDAATSNLVRQARRARVQRFVFVSSIKAVCARTIAGAVSEDATPAPQDDYGRAKLAAERSVLACGEVNPIVLRPPLIFAPHAKGNFRILLRAAESGLPLPLASTDNQRSLISLASLVDALRAVLEGSDVGVFHIADKKPLSSATIVTALRAGMGVAPRLFSTPAYVLPPQLRESLWVDDTRFRAAFGDAWARDAREALVTCGASWHARR